MQAALRHSCPSHRGFIIGVNGKSRALATSATGTFPLPNPGELLSLSSLRAKLRNGLPIELWRAPRRTSFVRLSNSSLDSPAPSRARALRHAKGRQAAGHDMCVSGDTTCPLGAPSDLSQFKEAWGGISVIASDSAFGDKALSFAKSYLAELAGTPCISTHDPTLSCNAATRESVVFVHDRIMGRTPKALEADGAPLSDVADLAMAGEGSSNCALAHHILLTFRVATPVSEVDRIAMCEGWDQPSTGSVAATQHTPSSTAVLDEGLASPSAADDPEVADETLSSVCDLLLLLVPLDGVGGRLDLALEALLYVYLFKHRQAYFGGHLDRVVSLDAGRCAELVLAAEACAFPSGDYGHGEWAHTCLPPIIEACHAFLLKATDAELQAHLQVCALAAHSSTHARSLASHTYTTRFYAQANCLQYSPTESVGRGADSSDVSNLDVLDQARSIVALWPEADAGSLVAGHGSVIVSGLFAWAGDSPDPVTQLILQGQCHSLQAVGRAVGLVPAKPSCPPLVAFHMRRIDSLSDAAPSFMLFSRPSARTLGALWPHAQPCDGGDERAPCDNMSLHSLHGGESRCWLHSASSGFSLAAMPEAPPSRQ